MDIQKIAADIIAKLQKNPDLIKEFTANPVALLEKTFGIDLPDDQINQVINAVKAQLKDVDLKDAVGLLGKLKGFFGK